MSVGACDSATQNHYLTIGKSIEEAVRRRRLWRICLLLVGIALVGLCLALVFFDDADGTLNTTTLARISTLPGLGIVIIVVAALFPLSDHVVGFELSETDLTVHRSDGSRKTFAYSDISRMTVAYNGPRFLYPCYDDLKLIMMFHSASPLEIAFGRCDGETVESCTQKARKRIAEKNNAPLGSVAEDREFRKEQTLERSSASFMWLALVIFIGFWLQNAYYEHKDVMLYRHGERTVGTITGMSREGQKYPFTYDFADATGRIYSGSDDLNRWNGAVPKVHGPVEVAFYSDHPEKNGAVATLAEGYYPPLHLLMLFLVLLMVLAILTVRACRRPVYFRGKIYILRPGELPEEKPAYAQVAKDDTSQGSVSGK
jgi:hypothetical protein